MALTWRERYRPMIAAILAETADLPEPERTAERRRRGWTDRGRAWPATRARGGER